MSVGGRGALLAWLVACAALLAVALVGSSPEASDDPPGNTAAEKVELHLDLVAPESQEQVEALRQRLENLLGATFHDAPDLTRVLYADTEDRQLGRHHGIILRLRQKLAADRGPLASGKLTLKRRSTILAELQPLPRCDDAEVDLDLFSLPVWSAATAVAVDDLDGTPPTSRWALSILANRCPELLTEAAPLFDLRDQLVFPGSMVRSTISGRLLHHPLADDLEVTFEIWYDDSSPLLAELSVEGAMRHREEIERLGQELAGRLREQALLEPRESSKTDWYFERFGFGNPD